MTSPDQWDSLRTVIDAQEPTAVTAVLECCCVTPLWQHEGYGPPAKVGHWNECPDHSAKTGRFDPDTGYPERNRDIRTIAVVPGHPTTPDLYAAWAALPTLLDQNRAMREGLERIAGDGCVKRTDGGCCPGCVASNTLSDDLEPMPWEWMQVGWMGPYGIVPGGMDNDPVPGWQSVYMRAAKVDHFRTDTLTSLDHPEGSAG